MNHPAARLAARRRMLRLYPVIAVAGGALYLPNADLANSGTILGFILMLGAALGAVTDADKTTAKGTNR